MDALKSCQQLYDIYGLHEGPFAIIITQIDPDAIASGFALKYLLQKHDPEKRIDIIYGGVIAHPQNKSLVNRYDLRSQMLKLRDLDLSDYNICLVDSSKRKDSRMPILEDMSLPVIVIDHHRGSDIVPKAECFYWVDDELCACSTMLIELIMQLDEPDLPEYLKVLLAIGIYTDTDSLTKTHARDRDAYAFVTRDVPPERINRFINYPLPPTHFMNLGYALSSMKREGERLVAGIGRVDPEQSDDVSTVADYLSRMYGVNLIVVWGIVGNEVRLAARSSDMPTPLDQYLMTHFGDNAGAKVSPDGRGAGGARLSMDLGFWLCNETKDEVLRLVAKRIETIILSNGGE